MLPLRDKCREKIQGTEQTEMKRRIVLALCVAVGIGLTLMMPAVQVHSADKEQRFPLLKLEQLNDQERPFADCVRSASVYNMRHLESLMQMRVSTNYKSSFDACSSEIIGKSFFVRYLLAHVIHDLEAMANDMGYGRPPLPKTERRDQPSFGFGQ
jgi:hypothetical protein